MAVPPLFYEMYNPTFPYCTLNEYPPGCEWNPNVPCTRGENAVIAGQITLMYALVCNLVIIVFMGLLVFAVYFQEKKSDKYLSIGQLKKRDNTRDTAWQGVRYAAAITVPYLPLYVFCGYSMHRNQSMGEVKALVWLVRTLALSNRCSFFVYLF